MLTLKNVSAIGMSGLSAGGSLLRIYLKYSSHLDLCSTSLLMVLPSMSFTGFEKFLLFPASVSCAPLDFLTTIRSINGVARFINTNNKFNVYVDRNNSPNILLTKSD